MVNGRYTTEEISQVKESMLKFVLRVLEGEGTPAEVVILPEILKLLLKY